MTESYVAAMIRCTREVGDAELTAVRMIRRVLLVEPVADAPREILAVLDGEVRDDDFEEGVGPALSSFGFVASVQPLRDGGHHVPAPDCRRALLDLARTLRPTLAPGADARAIAAHASALQVWDRMRLVLFEASDRLR